jgi:hypothetical protein
MSLKPREELGVHGARLGEVKSWSQVSGHSEVRILVDSTRDQTKEILSVSQDIFEGAWNARGSLDGSIGNFAAVFGAVESEDSFDLIVGNGVLKQNHVVVEVAYVIRVSEKEGVFEVKAAGQNILGVFNGCFLEPTQRFDFGLWVLIEEFLIVGQLDDDWTFESLLHEFAEDKRKKVPEVHGLS